MHIVYLSGEYALWATGGVGVFLQTIGRALVKKGHAVSIVGVGVEDKEVVLDDEGVSIYRLPKNTSKLPNFYVNSMRIHKKVLALQKELPIDIIETAEGGFAFLPKSHPAKKIIRLHGGHHFFAEAENRGINFKKGIIEKRSFKKADAFIAVSEYVKIHTAKFLSYHDRSVAIINYPINTNIVIPEVTIQEDIILFAGTICEKKGVRELLQAFKIVREKYPTKKLDLYGRLNWMYPNGTLYIDQLKQDLDASYFENVSFKGSIPRHELDAKYAAASLCVFPSHMETQGLVSIEAMLLEKLVIFSKYGPGPETIQHKETGLLCDVYDPIDIANQIEWSITHEEEGNEIAAAGRLKVKEKYNLEHITEKNIAFYNTILNGNI